MKQPAGWGVGWGGGMGVMKGKGEMCGRSTDIREGGPIVTFAPMRGIYLRLKIIYICTLKMNFFIT